MYRMVNGVKYYCNKRDQGEDEDGCMGCHFSSNAEMRPEGVARADDCGVYCGAGIFTTQIPPDYPEVFDGDSADDDIEGKEIWTPNDGWVICDDSSDYEWLHVVWREP